MVKAISWFFKARQGKRGSAVMVAVKNVIPAHAVTLDSNLEMISVPLSTSCAMTVLDVCCRLSDAALNFARELHKALTTIQERYLVTNFPGIKWSTLASPSAKSRRFPGVCLGFNLDHVMDRPMRLNNIHDLSLTTNPEVIQAVFFIDGGVVTGS